MNIPFDVAEIRRMIITMEESARDEVERMEAMEPAERAMYIEQRDAAQEEFRQQLLAQGVPAHEIAIGQTELLMGLQKALDGKAPAMH